MFENVCSRSFLLGEKRKEVYIGDLANMATFPVPPVTSLEAPPLEDRGSLPLGPCWVHTTRHHGDWSSEAPMAAASMVESAKQKSNMSKSIDVQFLN